MTQTNTLLQKAFLPGALAGLVGGLFFGAAMWQLGLLPTIALLVGGETAVIGFIIHMIGAAVIGAGFGLLIWQQRTGPGETLLWGLTYGIFWWVLGPLTLLPLFLHGVITWDIQAAQANFPALLAHIWYGAATALALPFFRRDQVIGSVAWAGTLLRGGLAGLLAAWLLGLILNAQNQLPMMAMSHPNSATTLWLITLFIGLMAGILFAWLYPAPFDGAGAGLVRGTVYGFLWWVIGGRTLFPLLNGAGLAWSLEAMQADFASLPGYLLLGAATVLFYQWLHRLAYILFSDHLGHSDQEGVGTEGLRALGRGAVAGLVGGLLFTVIMVQIGFLPTVASLVGSGSVLTGFIVHLLIANLIGMSYGLLFRRQSYDMGSALGWGLSYGFVWWILGPLTLLPVFLGGTPQWTLATAVATFPALIGHLAYGAGLGVAFYWLEIRHRPWWLSRSQHEASRIARRKEQIGSSATAVWVLVVVIALTLPVILGM